MSVSKGLSHIVKVGVADHCSAPPHDFSDEVMEDYEAEREELFEGNWERVSAAPRYNDSVSSTVTQDQAI